MSAKRKKQPAAEKQPAAGRDRRYEYPDPTPVATLVTYRGVAVQPNEMELFMRNFQLSESERQHTETFEEANDFDIEDPEDDAFFSTMTPYELLEVQEDETASQSDANVNSRNAQTEKSEPLAENNETDSVGAQPKSAPNSDAPREDSPAA